MCNILCYLLTHRCEIYLINLHFLCIIIFVLFLGSITNSEEIEPDESGQNRSEYVVSNNKSSCPKELHKEKQSTEMRPPAASVKRVKKRVVSKLKLKFWNISRDSAIGQNCTECSRGEAIWPVRKVCCGRASSVAAATSNFTTTGNSEFYHLFLANIFGAWNPNLNSREASHVPFSPSSDYSLSTSSNDDDVLKQVMFQTFGPSSV